VVLISGPTGLNPPSGVRVNRVDSTEDLCKAVTNGLPGADVLIMAAAPADFRATDPAGDKRPRSEGLTVSFEPTVDVLAATASQRPQKLITVGFALETGAKVERAREKLRSKKLNLIVLNDATEAGAGFEVETNRVTLVSADGETPLPLLSKREVAEKILDRVETLS